MIDLVVLAAVVLGFGLISGKAQGTSLTPPMVFVAAGLLLGAGGLGVLTGTVDTTALRILAESTLVLVLFSDAVRIELPLLRAEYHFPLRLLAVGMPLALGLGTLLAALVFPGIGWWEAALVAAVLVPTDAALGAAVVSDRRLPVRIRQSINVESGLNDGIALPVVMLLVSVVASAEEGIESASWWVGFAARQIGFGLFAGLVVGFAGGWLLRRIDAAGWINATYRRLIVVAIAALAYGLAELATGNGFIAAFAAGLCFGAVAREQCPYVHEFAEREGELLSMLTFTMFGAVILGPRLDDVTWPVVGYAVGSLVLVRGLAVTVAMVGSKVRWETVAFLGWFGPRGLASILFALLVVERAGVAVADQVLLITSVTVLLSVVTHGVTAAPWSRGYGRRAARLAAGAPEHVDVTQHYVRYQHTER